MEEDETSTYFRHSTQKKATGTVGKLGIEFQQKRKCLSFMLVNQKGNKLLLRDIEL